MECCETKTKTSESNCLITFNTQLKNYSNIEFPNPYLMLISLFCIKIIFSFPPYTELKFSGSCLVILLLHYITTPGGGGGVFSYMGYRSVQAHRMWFLSGFGPKKDVDFDQFGLK